MNNNKDPDDWIETVTGRKFYLNKPEFDVEDIAHGLSNLCRFNGHTSSFYSVAEHSLLVADLMNSALADEEVEPLEGLLHDAHEAYLSDVPSPFKKFLPDWHKLEKGLEDKLRWHFALAPATTPLCKFCDLVALHIEAIYLMPDGGNNYPYGQEIRQIAVDLCETDDWEPRCLVPEEAKQEFLSAYKELA